MNVDDLLSGMARTPRRRMGRGEARRLVRGIEQEYADAVASGIDVVAGVDLADPLRADASDADRLARAAHLALLGRFTWLQATDEMSWSDELWRMLGHPEAPAEPSKDLFLAHLHPDDYDLAYRAIGAVWMNRQVVRLTCRMLRRDRTVLDVDCQIEVLLDDAGQPCGIMGTTQDVTQRERAHREVERLRRRCETVRAAMSEWDPETGLFTRARFADEVDRALRFGAGAVLVIRIEPLGIGADGTPLDGPPTGGGGELLRAVARALAELKEPGDQLGRAGPCEIAVLYPQVRHQQSGRLAEYLVRALRAQPLQLADGQVRVAAWGGLVRYTEDVLVASHDLLVDAEHAWRRARELGQPTIALGRPIRAADRQSLCRDLVADALRGERFTLYAQPILDLDGDKITRHELLLRVLDAGLGALPPTLMLDTAERFDAVFEIDLWVIEQAMRLLAESPAGPQLQVNLSGRSLGDARLAGAVDELVRRYRPDPRRLTFEITETAVIGNLTEARRFADRVKAIGCQLALDDFGSGYGSFRYLRMFPFDLVKIDGEFVEHLADNVQDQVMVRALVQVCQAYGIRSIAEFVQDEPTLELLREIGVELVQGYLIGRPVPVDGLFPAQPPFG